MFERGVAPQYFVTTKLYAVVVVVAIVVAIVGVILKLTFILFCSCEVSTKTAVLPLLPPHLSLGMWQPRRTATPTKHILLPAEVVRIHYKRIH